MEDGEETETVHCDFCKVPSHTKYLIRYSSKKMLFYCMYELTTACLTCAKTNHGRRRGYTCYFCMKRMPLNAFSSLVEGAGIDSSLVARVGLSSWNAPDKRAFLFPRGFVNTGVISCLPCSRSEAMYDAGAYFDFRQASPMIPEMGWLDDSTDVIYHYMSRHGSSVLASILHNPQLGHPKMDYVVYTSGKGLPVRLAHVYFTLARKLFIPLLVCIIVDVLYYFVM